MRVALLALLLVGLLACQPPMYSIPGDRDRAALSMPILTGTGGPAQAHPRPHLQVLPPGALSRLPKRCTVLYHGPSESPGVQLLELSMAGDRMASVLYTPPAARALPLKVGQEVRVILTPEDQESRFKGEGLVVLEPDGSLVAAIAAGGGLPPDILGPELEVGPSPRVAYSEVRSLDNLCLAMIAHHHLRVAMGGRVAHLRPGTWSPLQLRGRVYQLYALDVAEPADDRCGHGAYSSLAFYILPTGTAP